MSECKNVHVLDTYREMRDRVHNYIFS